MKSFKDAETMHFGLIESAFSTKTSFQTVIANLLRTIYWEINDEVFYYFDTMKRQKKDEKFQWVLFSDLFLSKLKPLLISRSKAKNQKNAGDAAKKASQHQDASFNKIFVD